MNWLSLLVPIAYLGILVGSLATFSHLYRQRQINAKLRLEPYFATHVTRDIYLTLHHQQDTQPDVKVPNSILCAALQERAIEAIMRLREIQTKKGPLNVLLQRGVVGDEMWQRLLRAEQEIQFEIKDVVAEANGLASEWGNTIFQSANEMAQNRLHRQMLEDKRSTLAQEKAAWDAQRESARKELESEGLGPAAVIESQPNSTGIEDKPKATGGSDDDAVLVETPGVESQSSTPGTGKKNKKKGKK